MANNPSAKDLQKRIAELETQLAEAKNKLQFSGIELEANEGLVKFMMDDMRRIYEDLLRSQSQLMQSDKLATIGLLTAGIVHEINNPLSAVNLAFSLLESKIKKITELSAAKDASKAGEYQAMLKESDEFVKQGLQCVASMARIVGDIRMFSRSDKGVRNEENVNNIIESVISIVWNSMKTKVTIKKELGDAPMIRCNAQQLSQVFLNLIVNASQAMGDKPGTITVRTFERAGKTVVQIADTGCGMTPEVKARLFEPFFTTKGAEQGTGLGLSITHDILKKHEAAIEVESEVGKGTTFTLSFPHTP
jgi:two-component system, NtrC family, sensor kinase